MVSPLVDHVVAFMIARGICCLNVRGSVLSIKAKKKSAQLKAAQPRSTPVFVRALTLHIELWSN